MLTEERHRLILELLEEERMVHSQKLMELLAVSESTIRRDLSQLEEQGLLVRVHGGAKRRYTLADEQNVQEKSFKNSQEKQEIAKLAASLIEDGDVVFLDAGTTTVQMIPFIQSKNITVVTNGLVHATSLMEMGISTFLIGGRIKKKTQAVIGPAAAAHLEQYCFTKVFLGMNGVDFTFGYTTPDEEEAIIKRLALSLGSKCYVLADYTKISQVSFCKVADLTEATLITNVLDEPRHTRYQTLTTVLETTIE